MAKRRSGKSKSNRQEPASVTTKKDIWKKRLAILLIIAIVLSVYAAVHAYQTKVKNDQKAELVQTMYDNMHTASGFTVTWELTSDYYVNHQQVELHYMCTEQVDQLTKQKKLDLHTFGTYMGTEIDTREIYYFYEDKCLHDQITTDEDGTEHHSYEESAETTSFDYNPMLSLALLITEQPSEFTLSDTTIRGSVSLKDMNTFLSLCPFNTLYQGIENLSCYKDQVNNLMVVADGEKFKSAIIDMTTTAFYMLKGIYEEQGLPISVNSYRITVSVDSWYTPLIEIPEVEEETTT